MNKIQERRKHKAVCPQCKSPDYSYQGRMCEPDGKHQFQCNSCKKTWQYGKTESIYTQLI